MGIYSPDFWNDEESLLWEAIAGIFLAALFAGVEEGANLLPLGVQPLVNANLVNEEAAAFAQSYRYDLIRGINETTRKQVQDAVTEWIRSGDPLSVLEAKLTPIFGNVRAEMIAVTEVTRAFAEGNAIAWTSTGFVDEFIWRTAKDENVCVICSPRDGQRYKLADAAARPPGHVRCRCWQQPVVNENAVLAQIDEVLNG